jgi:hypothetical protein
MFRKNTLSHGVKVALGLTAGFALGQSGVVLAEEDSAEDMEEVVVTGSRIKRTLNTASQDTHDHC